MTTHYFDLLASAGSPLLNAGDGVRAQLREQFHAVVDEAAGVPHQPADPQQGLSSAIGRDRAASGVHPSESLAAARLIFRAALPELAEHFETTGIADATNEAALRLNDVILRRMSDAAKAYVEYLLEKSATAHADEARRLSRDLHDDVGPTVAVGLQNLELIEHYLDTDPERAREKIVAGREALVEAIALVRTLAAETRLAISPLELPTVLQNHLANLPVGVRSGMHIDADLDAVPVHSVREIFLVLREAIRNAAQHGQASEVTVDLRTVGTTFLGIVTDDGRGFDTTGRTGTGIAAMHERAALLGGDITIESEPSQTTVTLTIPLPRSETT